MGGAYRFITYRIRRYVSWVTEPIFSSFSDLHVCSKCLDVSWIQVTLWVGPSGNLMYPGAGVKLSNVTAKRFSSFKLTVMNSQRMQGMDELVGSMEWTGKRLEKLVRDWRKKSQNWKHYQRWQDRNVLEWSHTGQNLRINLGVSGTMIRLKAKAMPKEMPPEDVEGFTGSALWFYRFMKRKGPVVRKKTKIAQRLPLEQLRNMDESLWILTCLHYIQWILLVRKAFSSATVVLVIISKSLFIISGFL